MESIPPVFQEGYQRWIYNFFPKPPISFPVTPGEIENFPRNYHVKLIDVLKHRYKQRKSLYRAMTREIASNARRPKRGKHIFVIKPDTMERLLDALASIPSPKSDEVRRIFWAIYYQGKTPEEAESMVSERTLSRHLVRAERMAGVLPEDARKKLEIGIPTIKISYRILRFGRDGLFDVQQYFSGRIF